MGWDELQKTIESNSAMADEDDRCKDCGCLLGSTESLTEKTVYCNNYDCPKCRIIIRRIKI
jgi:hypothetical protein